MELLYAERTVVIRNRGSVEFTPPELAADILLVDVRCTAIGGTTYVNNKTLPPYGFYGSITLFAGATVRQKIALEFPYQRVIDFETDYRRIKCYLTKLEKMLQFIGDTVSSPNNTAPAGGDPPDSFKYRGLPYSKIKINSERLAQYEIVVRHYLEATEFECAAESSPTDPTDGEPEYPTPQPIPNSGEFPPGLPDPDAPYPGADPNDFDPDALPAWTPKAVYFGLEVGAWNGDLRFNCTANFVFNENVVWENAGPPPYTTRNAGLPSPCSNAGNGYVIVASDGSQSPVYNGGGTTYYANINVFQFYPFPPPP